MENATFSMVTSSGMSACSLILQSLPNGSKIPCGDDVYGAYRLLNTIYNDRFEIKHINTTDIESVKNELNFLNQI